MRGQDADLLIERRRGCTLLRQCRTHGRELAGSLVGLGFGFGAAVGFKIARPERTVIATLGDGAYFFAEPTSCHFVQRAHDAPVLTVVFNNQRWEAVRSSAAQLHPDGWSVKTGRFPLSDLTPSPRFEDIVKAFDGYGERVEEPHAIQPALRRAQDAVSEGVPAVVNVILDRTFRRMSATAYGA